MRRASIRWAVAACALVAGCGKAAEGPVVGTWELDVPATTEANVGPVLAESRERFEKLETELKQELELVQGATEEERAARREDARKKMLDRVKWDSDQTEILQALFRSSKEASDLVEKKARERAARVAEVKVDMTYRADATFVMRLERKGGVDVSTGTWSLAGDHLAVTSTIENGVAVPAKRQEAHLLTAKEGRLEMSTGPVIILFRRRSGPPTDSTLDPARVEPCGFVTAAEVATVVGHPVQAGEPSARSIQCSFHTVSDPTWQIVSIEFERRSPEQATRFKQRMGDSKPEPGVGDLAYANSVGFYVLKGDLSFAVYVQPKPTGYERDLEAAKAIAKLIVPRLK